MSESFEKSLEKIATDYHLTNNDETKIFDHLFHLMLAEKLNSLDVSSSRILELGYGEGTISQKLFSDNFRRRTLIEGSLELARKAKIELGDEITVVNSLFEDYTPKEKFDLVIASNILEHVYEPVKTLIKIKSWLNPSGRCIITVPNSESFHRRLAKCAGIIEDTKQLSKRDLVVGHLRVYDLDSLTNDVEKSGMTISKVEGMVLKFLDNESQLKINSEVIRALHELSSKYPAQFCANLYMEVVI
jgi:2-polyprenyl-3-methyl-5-hydroxy-6-metoxy-1,4-benzoquinol methylase